jgi:hypothetical protein
VCVTVEHTGAQNIPPALDTIAAEDGSVWERVSEPGFGTKDNINIIDILAFQDSLYAITRNHVSGFEIWKTSGDTWIQVTVPGFTDSIHHNQMCNSYGDIHEYDGYLYIAAGSSVEGSYLYDSAGLEIWRFDGAAWEPVVSNSVDDDESGTITEISNCSDEDGDTTAEISDASKSWSIDQFKGGILRIISGEAKGRLFNILGNTATTLTVQQNEESNSEDEQGIETEFTVCDTLTPDPSHPELFFGPLLAGDAYEIGVGTDENGFGEIWNKNAIQLEDLNGELYVAVAHNYEDGTRIWKSEDGLTFSPMTDYSFGLFHGFDPEGNETGECLVRGVEDRNGNPVSSSTTHIGKSAVSGSETLYVGATGTTGCNGRGARVLRLDGDEWNFIVENFVDDNDEGTNEAGFGDAGSMLSANWQAWQWLEYDQKLIVSIARQSGARMMYTDTGSADDGAWSYLVGGDAGMPDGFDGMEGNLLKYGANIGSHLHVFNETLYAGTFVNAYSPALFAKNILDGADIWKATGPVDELVWSRVTSDGFGDNTLIVMSAFATFNDALYVSMGNLFGNFSDATLDGYSGALIYRLREEPSFVTLSSFTGSPGKNYVTLNWSTSDSAEVTGYNLYRSTSEKYNRDYRLISELGQDATSYTDRPLFPRRTYYYKLEAVSSSGNTAVFGPIAVKTNRLFGFGS